MSPGRLIRADSGLVALRVTGPFDKTLRTSPGEMPISLIHLHLEDGNLNPGDGSPHFRDCWAEKERIRLLGVKEKPLPVSINSD